MRARAERWKQTDRLNAQQGGRHFVIRERIDEIERDVRFVSTLDEAIEQWRRVPTSYPGISDEIPMAYYDQQAHLVRYHFWIEHYAQGVWSPVAGYVSSFYRIA
jgi:hypothetical protein